jgi:RHS repeat-associated protein
MGGTRFSETSLAAHVQSPSRLSIGRLWRGVGLLTMLLVGVLALGGAEASAESLCTDTWTGPSEGNWITAGDWSAGVPASTTVACIGSGKTVNVSSGSNQTGVVQGEGALAISGGSLEAANTLEVSSIHTLTLSGGVLTGAGKVDVSGSLAWSHGEMSGSGSTVLDSGASGTVGSCSEDQLTERTLVNEGTMALTPEEAELQMSEGARLENKGTFKANAQAECNQFHSDITLREVSGKPNPVIVNTGTFEKTEGTSVTYIEVPFENSGTVDAATGQLAFSGGGSGSSASKWQASPESAVDFNGRVFSMHEGTWEGSINVAGAEIVETGNMTSHVVRLDVSAGSFGIGGSTTLSSATVSSGSLTIGSGSITTTGTLTMSGGVLGGAGRLAVSGSLAWSHGEMAGSGSTVLDSGASGTVGSCSEDQLTERTLINEGTMALTPEEAELQMSEGARLENKGTFKANAQAECNQFHSDITLREVSGKPNPVIVNTGTFEKTEGTETTYIEVPFENAGRVQAATGGFFFYHPIATRESSTQYGGAENPSAPGQPHPTCGDPVSCATGNLSETQTDFAIGGRGVGLDLTRTYNAQAAAAGEHGAFGYGWTSSFSDHLVVNKTSKLTTLYQAEGSTVPFTEGSGGSFTAPAWTQDSLSGTEVTGYTLTLADQTKYKFAGASGRLESVTDRDGNATTLAYTAEGRLETITDPDSRKITLAYNAEGLVESAKDPMGHTVKYTYEGGNLKSVTQPAEVGLRWQFKYDEAHEITEVTDGRGGKTLNEYNGAHQVIKQKDPAEHTLTFEYETFQTKVTNTNTGSVTLEQFTSSDEPSSITHGYGTASATSESFTYNAAGLPLNVTDGDGHTTTYEYDASSNKMKMVDANKNETKWTYNSTHDVETTTTPKGEVTTIKREAHGNPESISRSAPGSTTQTTKYKYLAHGELESVEDPLKRVWKYEYDAAGDRTSEADPLGDKRTWGYNEDSQETSTVSPRGNVAGGEPAKFTTKIERDAQGRALTITDPLAHTTKYTYDGDGNVETLTDGNGHTTKYTYSADNQPIKVEAPNKAITETGYDGAGQVTSQADGNKHVTKYVRNVLEQVTEVEDPLKRKTTKTYDLAGNLKTLVDPAKRTTTYTYDPGNRLKEVVYSSGKPATIKYEYDKDGDRTSMTDGTGTSKYTFDQLDRLTEAETGHKEKSKYEYDLANEQTKITYPNTKSVTRAYDKAGRLEKVTDWLEGASKFSYDADSDLTATTFPTSTGDVDKYEHNQADQMSSQTMVKGTETLASLAYAHDNDGQVKSGTVKGLPGEEKPSYEYDTNNRLTKGVGIAYEYDAANNATKIGAGAYKYNAGSELETGPSLTYTYDELGERTKTKPTTGPATTYGYDQAGELTLVERPKEGETTEIKDAYAYDGNGLRASQAIAGTTTYMVWDMTEGLPLLLSDTTNSYIYGPSGLPIEQVSSGGTVTYLHHDQQGSTRLLTGSTGTVTGSTTFDAYGNKTGSTGTSTTPLGYDGQYTSADTGLIYMRARTYDPATAQFLSVDPIAVITRAPYVYSYDDPLTYTDPLGLWPGEGLVRGAIDVIAVGPYTAYYLSYEAGRAINHVGEQLGPGGSVLSHVVAAPLLVPQLEGLTVDGSIDALKGQLFGGESICDEGVRGSINPLHSFLPSWLQGPNVYLPGIHPDGSVDTEW